MKASGIYVSVSSYSDIYEEEHVIRRMEVFWWGVEDYQIDDYIALWDHKPPKHLKQNILRINRKNQNIQQNQKHALKPLEFQKAFGTHGGITFDITWDKLVWPKNLSNISKCFPYWATYIRNETVLHSSCLKLRPNWMWELKNHLTNFKLSDVMWPGTHEMGIGGNLAHSAFDQSKNKHLIIKGISVWQQLVMGIRYFDLRIGFDKRSSKFVILHINTTITDLKESLNEISNFMEETKEIIILSISYLAPSILLQKKINNSFLNLLSRYFNSSAVPRSLAPDPSFSKLWNQNYRIIITYPGKTSSEILWDTDYRLSLNAPLLEDFLDSLSQPAFEVIKNTKKGLHLRSYVNSVIRLTSDNLNLTGSLVPLNTETANSTIHPMTLRTERKWCPLVDVLLSDFFLSTDVIEIAIEISRSHTGDTKMKTVEKKEKTSTVQIICHN